MTSQRTCDLRTLLLLLAVALIMQLPLILNPGYYSHDELQWASWSVGRPWHEVPWAGFLDWATFQYRPLTFNVWMQLSRWFFETPYLMHAACVLIGTVNALLLHVWMRQLGASRRAAFIAALLWLLNPYAAHTHAWVGTLADSLWVLFALAGIVWVQHIASKDSARVQAAGIGLISALLALLCKEAALVIPAAYFVSWYCLGRRPHHLFAGIGSTLAVVLYLAVRLQPMIDGTQSAAAYSLDAPAPWARWAEYLIFPALLERFEPRALLASEFGKRYWLSIALISTMSIILLIRNWRLGMLWLLAPLAALVPVLPLSTSYGHYAYGASVAAALLLCLAAPIMGRLGSVVMIVWLTLTSFHGLQIVSKLQKAGHIQSALLDDIDALRRQHPQQILRIRAALLKHQPIVMQSLFIIPSYRGIAWGEHVVPVLQEDASANYQMLEDGSLAPYTAP